MQPIDVDDDNDDNDDNGTNDDGDADENNCQIPGNVDRSERQ